MEITGINENLETIIEADRTILNSIKSFLNLYSTFENLKEPLKSELINNSYNYLCPLIKPLVGECSLELDKNNILIQNNIATFYCKKEQVHTPRRDRKKGEKEIALHPIIELNFSKFEENKFTGKAYIQVNGKHPEIIADELFVYFDRYKPKDIKIKVENSNLIIAPINGVTLPINIARKIYEREIDICKDQDAIQELREYISAIRNLKRDITKISPATIEALNKGYHDKIYEFLRFLRA